ncbi:MAG: VWA domain-containing protein [Pseudomonadota bacterium]|nr:VWA domain-containing protein [Pseudomonadota bacterium]
MNDFLREAHDQAITKATSTRLIFAMDATASREPTWDLATSLHAELFNIASAIRLDVQLVYYRGLDDFFVSGWNKEPRSLLGEMQNVRCRGGRTQILRVLQHARRQIAHEKTEAVVFVGDCCEESANEIYACAGELGLFRLPVFVFQEGNDPHARQVFKQIATRSRGAYARFAPGSAKELAALLGAVVAYATNGKDAVSELTTSEARHLLKQLPP